MIFDIEGAHARNAVFKSTMTSRKDDITEGEAVREHGDGIEKEHYAA